VISTVNIAKGLEWKRVKVVNDFLFKSVDGRLTVDEDELRLLYVASNGAVADPAIGSARTVAKNDLVKHGFANDHLTLYS